MAYKILVADDEAEIREVLRLYLEKEGYEIVEAADGTEAVRLIKKEQIDLALLDIMMPGMDGYRVLRSIREENNLPVIMLSAKSSDSDKILGLDLGADDYLVKPFGMMEMVSRVKAVLRRCQPASPAKQLTAGGLTMDLEERTVTADGARILLTYKEFELLRLFLSRPGVAFTREQLLSDIWGVDYTGETRTVDMHIKTLRQKLGDYGGMIETVRHIGYRLEAKA